MRRHIYLLLLFALMPCIALCQSWEILYQEDNIVKLVGGDCNENGNYIVGRIIKGHEYNGTYAYAMFVNNDGSYEHESFVLEGGQCMFESAICLDNGNLFVAGKKSKQYSSDVYDTLWIAVINQELEIVEEHSYPVEDKYYSWDRMCLTKDNNGELLLAGNAFWHVQYGVKKDHVICRFDANGNMIEHRYYEMSNVVNADPTDITMMPETDNIMLLGRGFNPYGKQDITYFDENLDPFSHHKPFHDNQMVNWVHAKHWLNKDQFLMSAMIYDYRYPNEQEYAAVFKCDTAVNRLDTLIYNRYDTCDYTAQFCSLLYVNDSTILLPTFNETGGMDSIPNDAVICLIDNDLNLLGTKRIQYDDVYFRILHCQKTNDGGCLIYGYYLQDNTSMVHVLKLMRDEFVVPCSITENSVGNNHNSVFPNPVADILNIIVENVENQSITLSISNVNGLKMFERKMSLSQPSTIRLDVSSFEKGVYVYQILDGKKSFCGKFIKE